MRQLGKSKASEYLIARHGVPVSKARLTGDRLAGTQKRLLIVSTHVLPAALKLVAALQIAIDCDRHDIEIMKKVRDGMILPHPRMAGPLLPRQLNYALRNIDCGSVLKFKLPVWGALDLEGVVESISQILEKDITAVAEAPGTGSFGAWLDTAKARQKACVKGIRTGAYNLPPGTLPINQWLRLAGYQHPLPMVVAGSEGGPSKRGSNWWPQRSA